MLLDWDGRSNKMTFNCSHWRYWHEQSTSHNHHLNNIDYTSKKSPEPLFQVISESFKPGKGIFRPAQVTYYTDSSRILDQVGAAACSYLNDRKNCWTIQTASLCLHCFSRRDYGHISCSWNNISRITYRNTYLFWLSNSYKSAMVAQITHDFSTFSHEGTKWPHSLW